MTADGSRGVHLLGRGSEGYYREDDYEYTMYQATQSQSHPSGGSSSSILPVITAATRSAIFHDPELLLQGWGVTDMTDVNEGKEASLPDPAR